MSGSSVRFPYVAKDETLGRSGRYPYMPITLSLGPHSTASIALMDSGASLNVLPYGLGIALGATWDRQTTALQLTGNLALSEARVLLLWATVAWFPPIRLAFAWTRAESVPVILGQVNFFMEYDVCFFGSRSEFEVSLRS